MFFDGYPIPWLRTEMLASPCQSQGMEVIQIRLAGQIVRLEEVGTRVQELIDGVVSKIPELEDTPETTADCGLFYQHLATASTTL